MDELLVIDESSNELTVVEEIQDSPLVVEEAEKDSVEVWEGGLLLDVTSTTVINGDQVLIDPPIVGLSDLHLLLQQALLGYTHTQNIPSDNWVVTHNLQKIPEYSLFNLAGENQTAGVTVTTTQAFVSSTLPITGILVLR